MKKVTVIILSLFGLVLILRPFVIPHPSRLWVLSVGQGESVLYQDTSGKLLLFDGGPDDTVLAELGRVLPPWQHHIDVVVLSHTHADHLRGLIAVLERYTVGAIWDSGTTPGGNDVARWHRLISVKQIPEVHPFAGTNLQIGTTRILTLHPMESMIGKDPKEAHDATVVLQLITGTQKILLSGDLNEGHERDIMNWCQSPQCNLQSEILQVPHHGSDTGLSPPFLAAVRPRYAFICVGQNNKFRHPRAVILERLETAKIPYLRTDTEGGAVISLYRGKLSYQKSGSVPR